MEHLKYKKVILIVTIGVVALLVLCVAQQAASYVVSSNPTPLSTTTPTASITTSSAPAFTWDTFAAYRRSLPSQTEDTALIAVGDNMLSRGVAKQIRTMKSVDYPFAQLTDFLHTGDIVFGNLETAITPGRAIQSGEMTFRSDPEVAPALKRAGFTIMSLANNHSPNFGQKGLKDTFRYLGQAGVAFVGAGVDNASANAPVFLQVKGKTFAFLAYNDSDVVPDSYEAGVNHAGTAFMRIDRMKNAVKAAKKQADFVIVSMHSGKEYSLDADESQVNFAHSAIDAGAELVLGHHPHTIQPVTEYKGKYIIYSLGNFVFDQMWSRPTRESVAVKIYFNESGVHALNFYPLLIENYAQPRFMTVDEKTDVWHRLHNTSLIEGEAYRYVTSSSQLVSFPVRTLGDVTSTEKNIKKEIAIDLDADTRLEKINLEMGKMTIMDGDNIVWNSPADWWVDDVAVADVNGDGIADINFSVWKAGSFGPSRPFWVKENDMSVKNHFFVFDYLKKKMVPQWQSSNLDNPNCAFALRDADRDGKIELLTVEGSYKDWPRCQGNKLGVWKWNGWGFSREAESTVGNYSFFDLP